MPTSRTAIGAHHGQDPDNERSRKLIEKLGFRCEGHLRDNLHVGDDWRDDMLYARLATDLWMAA